MKFKQLYICHFFVICNNNLVLDLEKKLKTMIQKFCQSEIVKTNISKFANQDESEKLMISLDYSSFEENKPENCDDFFQINTLALSKQIENHGKTMDNF